MHFLKLFVISIPIVCAVAGLGLTLGKIIVWLERRHKISGTISFIVMVILVGSIALSIASR